MLQYAILFSLAALLSVLLTPLVIRFAQTKELLDHPGERKVHTIPIPHLGGISVFVAFWGSIFLSSLFLQGERIAFISMETIGFFLSSLVILGIGVYDDLYGASPAKKISFQFVASVILIGFTQGVNVMTNPLGGGEIELGFLSIPIAIIWLIAVTNAFNLIDGLDGLAAGVGFIVSMTAFLIAFHFMHSYSMMVSVALAGALFGFFRYNSHPARIFLGDSGSFFIGFMIAAFALKDSQKSATFVSILIPILALGLPLMDVLLAVIRRYIGSVQEGNPLKKLRNLFIADQQHIHHRLISMGFSHKISVYILYGICTLFGLAAYMLSVINDEYIAALLFFVSVIVFLGVRRLGYIEFKGLKKEGEKEDAQGEEKEKEREENPPPAP